MSVKSLGLAFTALAALAAGGSAAQAGSLSAQYFDVSDSVGGDFGTCCSSPPATLPVIAPLSALSSGGLPVTTLAAASGGVIDQSPTGEILWWTPSAATGINATGTGTFTLGQSHNMFAPNSTGSNDGAFFETAILSGTLTGSGHPASLTVTSDDDALVYVDGQYVGDNPGVHGNETAVIDLGSLTGKHSLEIFYADRAQVGADLAVSVAGAAVPEPATWAMMLVGFGGLGVAMRSRRKPVAATA